MQKVESRYMPGRQKLSRREAINDFKWRECKETLRAWSEAGKVKNPKRNRYTVITESGGCTLSGGTKLQINCTLT